MRNTVKLMRNFPTTDTRTLPRISQIDCLPQNRLNSDELEQKRRADKIEEDKNHIMAQTVAMKEQGFGRRGKRTNYTSGILPPISQISMGGRQLPAEASLGEEGLKLPPISQVACLGGYLDEKQLLMKQSKSRIRDSDSEFVRLSKAGGQKNLLCYTEADSTSPGDVTNANTFPRSTRYNPGFTSEADPRWRPSHWSDFSRQKYARSDHKLIWR